MSGERPDLMRTRSQLSFVNRQWKRSTHGKPHFSGVQNHMLERAGATPRTFRGGCAFSFSSSHL
jgi:hypothetical protein